MRTTTGKLMILSIAPLCALAASCGSGDGQKSSAGAADTSATALSGKDAFASCAACHNLTKGAAAKLGPNLYGVIGRKAGGGDGYSYSNAIKASGITWTEADLDAFIASPTTKIPGTKMGAGAVQDAAKRAAIIAYIKEESAK
jgi:cytochrome c